jgi:phosphatidylglycerophosphate synthase
MRSIKNIFLPKTRLGKWSIILIIVFILLLLLFFLLVSLGERGGDTFFSNLKLTIPMLVAGACAIASFFTGLISIIKKKERCVFVFIATIIGFLVLLFVIGEFSFPH